MKYIARTILPDLQKWIDRREIYAIKGPRQSGKTTILKILQDWLITEKGVNPENIVFFTLEDRELLEKFSVSPKDLIKSYLSREKERYYFLIDEFQYLPDGGRTLKLLYDLFENVKFIITGSSSLELAAHTGKFLVGRVFNFYLWQLSFQEFLTVKFPQLSNVYQEKNLLVRRFISDGKDFIVSDDIFGKDFQRVFEDYVLWGGYPEVVKTDDNETRSIILKNILETYLTRDIVELLKITDLSQYRKLMVLLSSRTGNLISYQDLTLTVQSYFQEIKKYLSILEETFVINLLKPYFSSKGAEIKKNPKLYFQDTGLRNYLIQNFIGLSLRPDKGALVENVVFNQLKIKWGEKYQLKYWRTLAKAEIDFVLESPDELLPAEVKYSEFKQPQVSRSFRNFVEQYKPKRALVLTNNFWSGFTINSTNIKFLPVWYL